MSDYLGSRYGKVSGRERTSTTLEVIAKARKKKTRKILLAGIRTLLVFSVCFCEQFP